MCIHVVVLELCRDYGYSYTILDSNINLITRFYKIMVLFDQIEVVKVDKRVNLQITAL